MRRMIFAVAALFVAATAGAFDTNRRPATIALLAPAGPDDDSFRRHLAGELHARGYDAFLRDETIKDVGPDHHPIADYYVEVLGAGGTPAHTAVAVGAGCVDVGVGLAHVGATINLYDARTATLIEVIDPSRTLAIVAPRTVITGRSFFAALTLPFVQWAQGRNAMRTLARDAAREIDQALRH